MGDSELQNKMDELQAKIDVLNASLGVLDTSIATLTTALNTMSSKMVTAVDTANVVTGYATKFGIVPLGFTDEWTDGALGAQALAFDGEWFYSGNGSNVVEKTKPGGAKATFCTSSAIVTIGSLAYDSDNGYLYVGETGTVGAGTDALLETYDSSGTLVHSVQINNPVAAPAELNIICLAYDYDNSQLYIFYYGPTVGITRYGKIDPSTGLITDYVDINDLFQSIDDGSYYNGVLYIGNLSADIVYGFKIGDAIPLFTAEVQAAYGITPSYTGFAIDPETAIWYNVTTDLSTFQYNAFTHVQRISVFDDGGVRVSVDTDGENLPVSAASLPLPSGAATSALQTTMVTALQKIDDLQNALRAVGSDVLITQIEEAGSIDGNNVAMSEAQAEIVVARADRKGLLLLNNDTDNTVWIGATGVTIGTGVPLLPYQSMALNHYTGSTASVYGICDAGKTANIRYLEAF